MIIWNNFLPYTPSHTPTSCAGRDHSGTETVSVGGMYTERLQYPSPWLLARHLQHSQEILQIKNNKNIETISW